MSDKSTDGINRYIHFGILGNCCGFKIVPYGRSGGGTVPCEHARPDAQKHPHPPVPDYTTSLDLIAPVERKVLRMVGSYAYLQALCHVSYPERDLIDFDNSDWADLIMATPSERATACVAAHKEHTEKKK